MSEYAVQWAGYSVEIQGIDQHGPGLDLPA
jgi:hypothetical protein